MTSTKFQRDWNEFTTCLLLFVDSSEIVPDRFLKILLSGSPASLDYLVLSRFLQRGWFLILGRASLERSQRLIRRTNRSNLNCTKLIVCFSFASCLNDMLMLFQQWKCSGQWDSLSSITDYCKMC